MPKLDKTQYSKQEFKKIMQERKLAKQHPSNHIKQTTPQDSKTAFVLGNGISRQEIDLTHLQQYGPVYGCNALYREFSPDYLVAVDVKMVIEINKAGYQQKNTVWTNLNRAYKDMEGFNYFNPSKGWSSGPTALYLASQHKYERIFILGFDYMGLESGKRVNNLYAGTPNYKRKEDTATYYGNWLRQTEQVIKESPQIQFRRVILPDNFCPGQLNNYSNFANTYMNDFKKMFNFS